MERILKLGEIEPSNFDTIIEKYIEEYMGEEFTEFIHVEKGSFEEKLFQAATKLATRIELSEIRTRIPEEAYIVTARDIEKTLQQYNDIPGFSA